MKLDRTLRMLRLCALPTLLGTLAVVQPRPLLSQESDALAINAKAQARAMAMAFQQSAAKMMPSVVTVMAKRADADKTLDELELLQRNSDRDYNIGSGVIFTAEGLCVTNNHVLKDTKGIVVRLSDGREMIGVEPKLDPKSDLAVFRIMSTQPLPAAELGDSDALNVGDWVIAIGSPFGLDHTVSVGVVSGKDRSIPGFVDGAMLQTDASINPGNSGGALLDLNGELVGINTAIASSSGAFQGVGFAVPVNRVKWITNELVLHGSVRRPKLGVRVERIPQPIADEFDIPVRSGVYVSRIVAGSPAAKSGLDVGDIIIELADQKTRMPAEFSQNLERLQADKTYPLKILRNGKSMVLQIQPALSDN